jgi:hypothetical protein
MYFKRARPVNLPDTFALSITVTGITVNNNGQTSDLPVTSIFTDECLVETPLFQ